MPHCLPKEFRFSHEYAFLLHDILASTVVTGEHHGVFDTEFDLASEEEAAEFSRLSSGEEVWEWIERSQHKRLIYMIVYKQVLHALLGDFCHYIYEALTTARKGKLSVAYTLLRKPLKDNLLFLEWLLAAPEEFICAFYHQEPEDYAVDRLPPEKKLEIIERATAKTSLSEMFDAKFVYELRYDKRSPWGFEQLWQQATHLVTNCKHYRTSKQNFNFIFSGEDDMYSQWDHIYFLLPYVLFYTVEVVESVLATFVAEDPRGDLTSTRRQVGFLLWVDHVSEEPEMRKAALQGADAIREALALECPQCGGPLRMGITNMKRFLRRAQVRCSRCKEVIEFAEETGQELGTTVDAE